MAKKIIRMDVVPSESLMKNINYFAAEISYEMAAKAREELVQGYHRILERYYNDGWSPRWYWRTDQLKDKSYVGVLDAGHPLHAFGGLSMAPERLDYAKMGKSYSNERIIDDFHESMHGGFEQSPSMNVWKEINTLLDKTADKVCSPAFVDEVVANAKAMYGL